LVFRKQIVGANFVFCNEKKVRIALKLKEAQRQQANFLTQIFIYEITPPPQHFHINHRCIIVDFRCL
jgi:hypothetical protein